MEAVIKKYQRKFRMAKDEMENWEALQLRFVSLFRNAASIILRLQEIQDSRCYGALKCVSGIEDAILKRQMDQLETLLLSTRKILEEFRISALTFEKLHRDAAQIVNTGSNQPSKKQLQHRIGGKPCVAARLDEISLLHDTHQSGEESRMSVLTFGKLHRDVQPVKSGPNQPSKKQLQHRIGIKPCIADCLDGLSLLRDMHQSEYHLKSSLFSALSHAVLKSSPGDLMAVQQLLVDQPNIQKEEVQHIFDIILAEEIG